MRWKEYEQVCACVCERERERERNEVTCRYGALTEGKAQYG
jgi:hypothetical protein